MRTIFTLLLFITYLSVCGQTTKLEYDWQDKIAEKEKKTILDYYLLLPSELLTGEMNLNGKSGPKDSYMFRVQSTQTECGKMNLVSGYLVACPDAYIHLALFRDRKNARDIIAYVKDCGEVPIQSCDYGFLYFDPERKIWKNANNVFPFERMKEKCLKIEKKKNWFDRQEIMPYFILPEFGTTIKVMDSFSDDKHLLFTTKWNGERFEIQ